jgi:hypothetical protein
MTSIAYSSILRKRLVSARGSGAQHATSSYDQGYWEGDRRGGRRHVLAQFGATGLGLGIGSSRASAAVTSFVSGVKSAWRLAFPGRGG